MKLQYRYAGIMIVFGLLILTPMIVLFSNLNQEVMMEKELQTIRSIAVSNAEHMSSHIVENAAVAKMISGAPLISDLLINSNATYEKLNDISRKQRIDALNRRWMTSTGIEDPFVREHLSNSVATYLKSQQEKVPGRFGEIFLTNRYGVMIASTGKLTTLAHAQKYWWKASYSKGEGRTFFDDRGFDTSVAGYVLGVVIPIKNGDEIIGILKCNVNIMGPLTDVIHDHAGHEGINILIARTGGLIVVEEGKTPLSDKLPEQILEQIQNNIRGALITNENDGNKLVAYARVRSTMNQNEYGFGGSSKSIDHEKGNKGEGWHLLVVKDKSQVIKEAIRSTRFLLYVGLIFIIVSTIIALLMGKWAAKPIVKLAGIAENLGEGNLDIRMRNLRHDEIGVLSKAFNQMAENLGKTLTSRDNLIKEIKLRTSAEQELQSSLKEKETLLREIHHRVKNNMGVISSLLNLQMMRLTDEVTKEALQDCQNRIQTMSMVHEALYQSENLASIDMKDYLINLTQTVIHGYKTDTPVTLNINVKDVSMSASQASPVGLIINELLVNSLKHAFPDNRKGEITVHLNMNNEHRAELEFFDNGIGFQDKSERDKTGSLGLKLVKSLAENQLDGSLKIMNENGARFIITFDMDRV
jgi:two-component sensor histidine kinase/HAMP domain-containing protein